MCTSKYIGNTRIGNEFLSLTQTDPYPTFPTEGYLEERTFGGVGKIEQDSRQSTDIMDDKKTAILFTYFQNEFTSKVIRFFSHFMCLLI